MTGKILHFHIPKTAGTALRTYFVDQRGAEHVSTALAGLRLRDALLQWSQLEIISGHFGVHQGDVLPQDRLCITVLRNPVDRLLSDFFFYKNNNDARLLNGRQRIVDLDAYIDTLSLAGAGNASLQMNMIYPLGAGIQEQLDIGQRVAAAKSALDRFALVGIQEDLEDFASMIGAHMRWPARPLKRENVTYQRLSVADLSATQRTRINSLLESDIELFAYAADRFKRDRRRFIVAASQDGIAEAPNEAAAATPVHDLPISETPKNFGNKRGEIVQVSMRGDVSDATDVLCGEPVKITVEFEVYEPSLPVTIGIAIKDERGTVLFGTNSMLLGHSHTLSKGRYFSTFLFLNRIGLGYYSIDASLTNGLSHHDGCYHWWERAGQFQVYDNIIGSFQGRIMLDTDFELAPFDPETVWHRSLAHPKDVGVRSFGRNNPPLQHFASSIELLTPVDVLPSGADSILPVRVRNCGREAWPCSGRCKPVTLSYRWYDGHGRLVVEDGLRTNLPSDVAPGSAVIVPLHVRAPTEPGKHFLAISLVQEEVTWFMTQDQNLAHFSQVLLS